MRKFVLLFLFVVIVLFGVTFWTSNPHSVTVNYYGLPDGKLELPLPVLVALVFLAGLILGAIFFALSTVKAKTQLARAKRKLAASEKELKVHGPAPVRNDPI